MWLTSEQAVQVMSGSRRQGDLQERFDDIQAFALSGRLSFSLSGALGGRPPHLVTGWAGEQTAAGDIDTLPSSQAAINTPRYTRAKNNVTDTHTHTAKKFRRAFVKSFSHPQKVARVLNVSNRVQKFSSGKAR